MFENLFKSDAEINPPATAAQVTILNHLFHADGVCPDHAATLTRSTVAAAITELRVLVAQGRLRRKPDHDRPTWTCSRTGRTRTTDEVLSASEFEIRDLYVGFEVTPWGRQATAPQVPRMSTARRYRRRPA